MLSAGVAVPILAALNASLSRSVGNPLFAVTVLCGVAFCTSLALSLLGAPALSIRAWPMTGVSYLGGVLFVFYIISITYSAPLIGLGNAVFFVLLGQLACAALIDHFGWFNSVGSEMTGKRAIGLTLMAMGVYLAKT